MIVFVLVRLNVLEHSVTCNYDKYLEIVIGTAVLLTLRSRKKHQKEKYLDALHRNLGNYIEHGISENIHYFISSR